MGCVLRVGVRTLEGTLFLVRKSEWLRFHRLERMVMNGRVMVVVGVNVVGVNVVGAEAVSIVTDMINAS